MSLNTISKSLQTVINQATGAVPGSTDVFVFAPAVSTPLVTNAKKCTLAQIISGGFPNLTYDGTTLRVPVFRPTTGYHSVDDTAGVTFSGASITTLSVKDGIVVGHT